MIVEQLTDPDLLTKSSENQQQSEFKLRRSESITSLNSYFFKTNKKSRETKMNNKNNNSEDTPLQKFDTSQIYLRLCINCSSLLEKKFKSCRDKITKPVFVAKYDVSKTTVKFQKFI